jgi:hypothetical protein
MGCHSSWLCHDFSPFRFWFHSFYAHESVKAAKPYRMLYAGPAKPAGTKRQLPVSWQEKKRMVRSNRRYHNFSCHFENQLLHSALFGPETVADWFMGEV